MRVNRKVRNRIAAVVGDQAIDELERWNDAKLDSLEDVGVEMSREEERIQQKMLDQLAERSPGRRTKSQ